MADVDTDHVHLNEQELFRFLMSVLDRANVIVNNVSYEDLQVYMEVLQSTIMMLQSFNDLENDSPHGNPWGTLVTYFRSLSVIFNGLLADTRLPSSITIIGCELSQSQTVGRPRYDIPPDMLEQLHELGFTWSKISKIFGVSRWTIHRRVQHFGLQDTVGFSDVTDDQLDSTIRDYIDRNNRNVGQTMVAGYLRSIGLRIQRRRIRKSLVRIDPDNRALRWGIVIQRRKYFVPWPNSLWHLDGHHSLIRWGLVVHGCIDGYSRRIIFLKCNDNNLSETVLNLFLESVQKDNGRWPSRIRVDYGVENVKVCDAMVEKHGTGRGSFIAGPSTRNQRIERLWRDVFRCVIHSFYYIFHALEDSGMLNVNNLIDMYALQLVYMPRINQALNEYQALSNDHPVRTERNWSPNQMWLNGMLNPLNPLANGGVDEIVQNLENYGIDPNAPSPFENSENNVEVPKVVIPGVNMNELKEIVSENIDILAPSNEMGIDIFENVKNTINEIIFE